MSIFLESGGITKILDAPIQYAGFAQYIGDQLTSYSKPGEFTDPDKMYETQRAVRTVVNFIAHNGAGVRLRPTKLDANDEQTPVRTPRVRKVFQSPDRVATQYEFLRDQFKDLLLWEKFAAAKTRDADGVLKLVRIPPRLFEFERLGGRPSAIKIGDDTFPLEQFLWLDGYAAAAKSPMGHLQDLLLEEYESAKQRANMWRAGAKHSGVIERPAEAPDWSPKARKNFRAQLEGRYTGESASAAGGVMLLEDGMVYKPMESMTARDSQQIEARKLSTSEVAAAYQVPPVFVGVLDNANYSNVKAYRGMLYSDVLGSLFTQSEQAWTLRVADDLPGVDLIEHDIGSKLQLSFEEQVTALTTATGKPVVTVAEARKRAKLPHLDGTDELYEKTAEAAPAPEGEEDDRDRIDQDEQVAGSNNQEDNNNDD